MKALQQQRSFHQQVRHSHRQRQQQDGASDAAAVARAGNGHWSLARRAGGQPFPERLYGALLDPARDVRIAQQMQNGRSNLRSAFHLLHLELFRPRDGRPPHQLIEQHDHRDHGGEPPQDSGCIAGAGRGLEIGTQTRQAEITMAQLEHFACHEEEPPAGHGNDGVPHQADGAERQLQLDEALGGAETIDQGGLAQLTRDGLERGIKAERHVPHLAGEDEHDRTQLHAQLPRGEQRHHGEHDAGEKAQHRDGLEDIQHGDHHHLHAPVVGGDVAVGDGKHQAQQVRRGHPNQGVEGIRRQRRRRSRDVGGRRYHPHPIPHRGEHGIDARQDRREHQNVHQDGPIAVANQRPAQLRESHQRPPASSPAGCGVSSGMKKRPEESRSNNSA